MSNIETTCFGIGTVVLALSAAAFLLMGRSDAPEKKHHYVLAAFITMVAACSYLAMTIGQGKVLVGGTTERVFYYARYLDWSITTPLLLLSLAVIALPKLQTKETLVAGLVGADLLMIVTGLFAGLSTGVNVYIWYIVSMGAFLAVLFLLWGSLAQVASEQPAPWSALFKRLSSMLTVLWIAYPIVFLIGTEALKIISPSVETAIFMVLDITAKAVFSFLLLQGVKPLPSRS